MTRGSSAFGLHDKYYYCALAFPGYGMLSYAGDFPAFPMVEGSSALLERLLAAANERRLAPTTLAAYKRAWTQLFAHCALESLDPASLPREKAKELYQKLTRKRSASHHLQVKAAVSFCIGSWTERIHSRTVSLQGSGRRPWKCRSSRRRTSPRCCSPCMIRRTITSVILRHTWPKHSSSQPVDSTNGLNCLQRRKDNLGIFLDRCGSSVDSPPPTSTSMSSANHRLHVSAEIVFRENGRFRFRCAFFFSEVDAQNM
jgi:hypothetical protein